MLFTNAAGDPMYCPYPLYISVPAMVGVHLVIGFIEGGITLAVYSYIKKVAPQTIYNPRGEQITASQQGDQAHERKTWRTAMWWIIGVAVVLSPIGLLASGDAWGEWGGSDVLVWLRKYHLKAVLPQSFTRKPVYHAAFSDYTIPGMDSGWQAAVGYILCAITAILIFVIIARIVSALVNGEKAEIVDAAGAERAASASARPLADEESAAERSDSAQSNAQSNSEIHVDAADIATSFLAQPNPADSAHEQASVKADAKTTDQHDK